MNKYLGYRCSKCGEEYPPKKAIYLCPSDDGVLDVILDIEQIKSTFLPQHIQSSQERSIWRYLPLLPVMDPGFEETPLRSVGWTPIYKTNKLAEEIGIENLWVKDESSNPSASFKDRASALLIARAAEIEAEVIVTASTGNAGAALAGMAAATGKKAVIFAPKSAPKAKIAQLLVFGAQVILVDGTYDDAVSLAVEASNEFGWYCRNTGYNPFTAEGKKTAAFEIWEQLLIEKDLNKALCIFVSVGDGNIISGIHKGFKDLAELGWLKQMPRIFGVQSEGSSAIFNAYQSGSEEIKSVNADTLADSISVDTPSDGLRALRAATQTKGAYLKVTDQSILSSIASLGSSGIFAEPAGAAAFSGMKKARKDGLISQDDPVLVMVTGSGLKDVGAAISAVKEAPIISPSIKALKEVL